MEKTAPIHQSITPPGWAASAASQRVLTVLAQAGFEARFVGGCVRDALLGQVPHDLDVATDARPEVVLALFRGTDGVKAIPTGLEHGTITVIIGDTRFEITTLRQDVATDGRHAVVAFGTDWLADAQRRDFTINALNMTGAGVIEDWTGGLEDLAAKRVRFIGDAEARIREDHLRMLRFFRFDARFGGERPDETAIEACRTLADLVAHLSGERLQDELCRLLPTARAGQALAAMQDVGLLSQTLTVPADVERFTTVSRHGDFDAEDAVLGLRLLLPDEAAPINQVADRLKLSNADRRRLVGSVEKPSPLTDTTIRLLAYREGRARAEDSLWLAYGDGRLSAAYLSEHLARLRAWDIPKLPVDGHAVIAHGVPPGPMVKQALAALEDWWFEHDTTPDRTALLAYLTQWLAVQEKHGG